MYSLPLKNTSSERTVRAATSAKDTQFPTTLAHSTSQQERTKATKESHVLDLTSKVSN